MEYFHGIQPVFGKEPLHFRGGVPPVVVVALQKNLLPRQGVDELEIQQGFLQTHTPAEVAAQHRHIVVTERGKALPDTVHIVVPVVAENIHGLVRVQRQMQVAHCV